ncbi:MAG: hypothetical protein ACE5FC_10480 [Myxococcota bacterium]
MAPTSDKTVIERSRPVQRVEAFIRRWDAADRWRRFFYPEFVCITNLFRLGKDDALVVHESLE